MKAVQRRVILIAMVQLCLSGMMRPLQGQADSGSRIRLTTDVRSRDPLIGTFISADSDSLRFTSSKDGQVITVASGSVVRLERSAGAIPMLAKEPSLALWSGAAPGSFLESRLLPRTTAGSRSAQRRSRQSRPCWGRREPASAR